MTPSEAAAIAAVCSVLLALVNVTGQVILSRQATKNHSEVMNGTGVKEPH